MTTNRDWTANHYDAENDPHAAARCGACGHFTVMHRDGRCTAGDHLRRPIQCECGTEKDAA